jgi:hypothetical protein
MSEIETRSFEARADVEERTITGLAVPYRSSQTLVEHTRSVLSPVLLTP